MASNTDKANEDYNIDWELFRKRLQRLMDSRGYTKADLADVLHLSRSTVTRYFYESTPEPVVLCLIADYFEVTLDYLLGRSNERWIKLTDEQQSLISKYTVATPADKMVIQAVLDKYKNE